jgi:hypothetical protein
MPGFESGRPNFDSDDTQPMDIISRDPIAEWHESVSGLDRALEAGVITEEQYLAELEIAKAELSRASQELSRFYREF